MLSANEILVKVNEYLDNMKYDTRTLFRSLGSKDTNFSLQAKNPGTKILHFYKNDNLTGEYIDDYVEVIILDQVGSNKTHIAAPPYRQPVPEKSKDFYKQEEVLQAQEAAPEESRQPSAYNEKKAHDQRPAESDNNETEDGIIIIEDTESEISYPDSDTLLKEAHLLYNEKEYAAAYEKIEEFFQYAVKKVDEGLFLKGQILEANSPIQDIKSAINAYSSLTKEYPASKFWDEANKRIVYLKRFYLEVR